jgi:predicted O-methyltransferase YrrM
VRVKLMASDRAQAIANSAVGHATQDPEELAQFIDVLLQDPPRTILEIGVAYGGTAQAWLKAATDDALYVGVDLEPERAHYLVRAGQSAVLIGGNSYSPQTYEDVVGALTANTIRAVDLLFIDGEHTEAAAIADYTNYAPLVRKGGIIAFHDAAGNEGVKAAIRSLGLNLTLIHNAAETRHCMGIGWMRAE